MRSGDQNGHSSAGLVLEAQVAEVGIRLVVEQNDLPGSGKMPLERPSRHGPAIIDFLMAEAGGMYSPAIEHLGDVADRPADLDEPKIKIHILRNVHYFVKSTDLSDQFGTGADQVNEVRMAQVIV